MRTRSTALPLAAIAMVALLAAGCSAPSTRSASAPDLQRSADAHVARATAAAGTDLGLLMPLCKPPAAAEPSQEDSDHAIARLIGKPRPQPGQAFDGVYFLGATGSAPGRSRPPTASS
jgi:metallo-beta-lactamase class B